MGSKEFQLHYIRGKYLPEKKILKTGHTNAMQERLHTPKHLAISASWKKENTLPRQSFH